MGKHFLVEAAAELFPAVTKVIVGRLVPHEDISALLNDGLTSGTHGGSWTPPEHTLTNTLLNNTPNKNVNNASNKNTHVKRPQQNQT